MRTAHNRKDCLKWARSKLSFVIEGYKLISTGEEGRYYYKRDEAQRIFSAEAPPPMRSKWKYWAVRYERNVWTTPRLEGSGLFAFVNKKDAFKARWIFGGHVFPCLIEDPLLMRLDFMPEQGTNNIRRFWDPDVPRWKVNLSSALSFPEGTVVGKRIKVVSRYPLFLEDEE